MKAEKITAVLAAAVMLAACSQIAEDPSLAGETSYEEVQTAVTEETTETVTETQTEPVPTETEPLPEIKSVTFTALGDNLIHSALYRQAARRAGENGGYDFTFAYEGAADLLDRTDITVLNQETLICNDKFEPSNYPRFNSPKAVGDHMKSLGVDVFTIANNHTLDMGAEGLKACLDYYDENDMIRVGVYRSREDRENIRTIEANGLTVSFLSYTESLNGNSLPRSSPMEIGSLYMKEMTRDIEAAKEISDICVVSLHWGGENRDAVEDRQRDIARQLAETGADVIIGNHSHVLSEVEMIERSDGGHTLCAYSLGNFISAQDSGKNLIGGTLDFTVNVVDGVTDVSDVLFTPVITHYDGNYSNIRLIKLSDYPPEMADSHGVRGWSEFGYDYIIDYLESKGLYRDGSGIIS